MLSLMNAGAASHSIEGAFAWDREQQVVQQDLCKQSYMEAATAWLRRPSMVLPRGSSQAADGRAECAKRGTSWGANRQPYPFPKIGDGHYLRQGRPQVTSVFDF